MKYDFATVQWGGFTASYFRRRPIQQKVVAYDEHCGGGSRDFVTGISVGEQTGLCDCVSRFIHRQPPERGHFGCPREVQRIAGIRRLGMTWLRVDSAQDLQAGSRKRS